MPAKLELVLPFHSKKIPKPSQVGGKAYSLILMTQKGFPVPPGFVLTMDFFKPWLKKVRALEAWKKLIKAKEIEVKKLCDLVKKESKNFPLSPVQKKAMDEAMGVVKCSTSTPLFAVRSSSPEEDLEGASFAGGYETSLGVTKKTLEKALRNSFASCLDYRIFIYKREKGFDVTRPSISIIVQQQLEAKTSGVAFSLNPLNNCYDEAVINSNFGLGETVVAGQVTPDQFVVDKVNGKTLEQHIAEKAVAVQLKKGGGIKLIKKKTKRASLSNEQVLEVTQLVTKVEEVYQKPMDIEWAYQKRKLYLLQARPITAYFPLPPEMITQPGEQKFLYWDATLGKQGIHEPMSVMGADYLFQMANRLMMQLWKDPKLFNVRTGIAGMQWGRMYQNFSNYFGFFSKENLVGQIASMDVFSAEVVRSLDMEEYMIKEGKPKLRGFLWRLLWNNLPTALRGVSAFWNPEKYKKAYQKKELWLVEQLKMLNNQKLSVRQFMDKSLQAYYNYFTFSAPTLMGSEVGRAVMKRLFKKEPKSAQARLVYLERALPDNITIEMGMAMYDLAHHPQILKTKDAKQFLRKWNTKKFPQDFLRQWNEFMERFGFRSPRELDLASAGYRDKREHFFQMLKWMSAKSDPKNSPQAIFERAKEEREKAYDEFLVLAQRQGRFKAWLFRKSYQALLTLGGLREIHKYYIIMTMGYLHRKMRALGDDLQKKRRLDDAEDIFKLTLDQAEKASKNSRLNLRKWIEENTAYLKKIGHVTHFPPLIDSRGKILRPKKKPAKKGQLVGQPISPGRVKGRVKVLAHPDEKPLLPGEILVAQATDPGWTPLFTNAGGIVLELGGMLQHGALVAREYGKPCIAGVTDATRLLKDGMEVEMDGLEGVVRILN